MGRNAETISALYEAFGKGDVEFILGRLSDDVRWDHWADNHAQKAGVPWLTRRTGRDEVRKFFAVVGEFQFKKFDVRGLMEGGNRVAAEIVLEAFIPSTGQTLHDEEMHLWTLDDDGRVTSFRHYIDTAKHAALVSRG